MKLVSNAVFILLLAATTAHAEGNHGFGPGFFGAVTEMCSEGDSVKADEFETRLFQNFGCTDDVTADKKSMAHRRNSKDPDVRKSYDTEFEKYMSEAKLLSNEAKAEMCRGLVTPPTSC
ncbi:MAG: hypothetical protein JWQ00_763 [Noviherbaspirillum sp.]|nr:hypothetical protein [Noviherbaspirillum sp.]